MKKLNKPNINFNQIKGLLTLFACVSIMFANYIVFFGTDNLISKLMLIPSTLFVAIFLIQKSLR